MDTYQAYYERPGPVIGAAVALPVLDIILVALRFQMRIKYKQGLGWDDWHLIPAALLILGFGISVVYGAAKEAIGYPIQLPPDYTGEWLDMQTDQITLNWLVQWADGMMISVALSLIKASFLLFYMRIFVVHKRGFTHTALLSLLVLVYLWGVAFFFAILFQCRSTFWANYGSAREIQMHCVDTTKMVLLQSITGFILDVFIIVLPIPLVWQLQLTSGKKLAVTTIFLLGAVAVAASLVRLIMMVQISLNAFTSTSDGLLIATQFLYWTLVECGVGIVAACLPTLQVFLRKSSWISIRSGLTNFYASLSTRSRNNGTNSQSLHPVQSVDNSPYYNMPPGGSAEVYRERSGETIHSIEMHNNGSRRVLESV